MMNRTNPSPKIGLRRQALIALALFTLSSQVEALTVNMRGVVDEVVDTIGLFDGKVAVGDRYSAFLHLEARSDDPSPWRDEYNDVRLNYNVFLGKMELGFVSTGEGQQEV